jgi:hypothetical protein
MPRFSELMKQERHQKKAPSEGTAQSTPPTESTEKIILFLPMHQLRWLDQIAKECKIQGGKQLWRGEVVRALIEGHIGHPLNLVGIETEHDLARRVRDLLP